MERKPRQQEPVEEPTVEETPVEKALDEMVEVKHDMTVAKNLGDMRSHLMEIRNISLFLENSNALGEFLDCVLRAELQLNVLVQMNEDAHAT